jgi:PAS domain S-box-containing protein
MPETDLAGRCQVQNGPEDGPARGSMPDAHLKPFDRVLYEGLLVAFGKVLSQYNAFARSSMLKDVGREVVRYLDKHGYKIGETGSIDDLARMIDLFTRNGFAEKLEIEPAEIGQRFIWHDLYLLDAYQELHELTDNPFLSCPLNLCLLHLADKHNKVLRLLKKTFDMDSRVTVSEYEIVDQTSPRDAESDPLVIENVRLYEVAQARADRLEKAQEELEKYADELLEAKEEAERQSRLLQEQTRQNKLLAQALQSTAECVCITDTSDHLLFVNESFLRTYGYEEPELRGQHIGMVRASSNVAAAVQGILPATLEGHWEGEVLNRRKDGSEFPIWLSTSAVRDEEDRPTALIGVAKDISERKQAEARLEAAQQRLVEMSRLAGMAEVATGILHNMGNLLNSVVVSATIISERIKESSGDKLLPAAHMLEEHSDNIAGFISHDPKGKRVLPYLAKLGERLNKERQVVLSELRLLTDRIEDMRGIVAAQQSYAKVSGLTQEVCLASLIEDVFRIMRPEFESCHIRLERDFKGIPSVNTDKHRVFQILLNLIRNAAEAIKDSGRPEGWVRVRMREIEEARIRIEVQDSGVGLAPENLTRVFAHGFSTKRDGHGFGLHAGALAAREMRGSLWAESEGLGHGATFVLELPVRVPAD